MREKLIELFQHDDCPLFMVFGELERLVDYLIAHGVTVSKGALPVADEATEGSVAVDKTEEYVHHINGNKTDNRPENLMLTDKTEHAKLHMVLRYKNNA